MNDLRNYAANLDGADPDDDDDHLERGENVVAAGQATCSSGERR